MTVLGILAACAAQLAGGCALEDGLDPGDVGTSALALDGAEYSPVPASFVDRFVAADGTARFIERRGDATIDLYMDVNYDRECQGPGTVGGVAPSLDQGPWEQSWAQGDPPYANGCGPVAGRNLLGWYGECVDFEQLGAEMKTNASASGPEWWAACAGFCGGEVVFCANICYGVLQAAVNTGSRSSDVAATMAAHTPAGYSLHVETHSADLARILRPLSEGNPVIALINTGHYTNHYVVVTGVYWDGGHLKLRLANHGDMAWHEFHIRWSLVGFGDSFENSIRDEIIGDKPYTMMYYSKAGSAWDAVGIAYDCDAYATSTWPDATPKFAFASPLPGMPVNVCYYRDLGECRADDLAGNDGCFDDTYLAHEWHCLAGEDCALADVDGDGRDDLVTFTKGPAGDVWVSLSDGTNFGPASRWHDSFCYGSEVCRVGDFNGDGRTDVVAFTRGGNGDVFVATSNGSQFVGTGALWHGSFCYGDEVCQVGDANGDGRDDILAFTRAGRGDVFVALSNGSWFDGTGVKWHDSFCYGSEVCDVADVDGDGRDDVVAFTRSGPGDVFTALSSGSAFNGTAVRWQQAFCVEDQLCRLGDVDGDGRGDLMAATHDTSFGDIYVARSISDD